MALVSAATLKEYLPELSGSTAADTDLNSLISRVESSIARFLGFPLPDSGYSPTLDQSTYTFFLDGPASWDSRVLQLPIMPVQATVNVYVDSDRVYGSGTIVPSTEYDIDIQKGIFILKETSTKSWERGYRYIKATVIAGWSTAPNDLIQAICIMASMAQRNKANAGKESIDVRGSKITISKKTMPQEVKEILYPLRSSAMYL